MNTGKNRVKGLKTELFKKKYQTNPVVSNPTDELKGADLSGLVTDFTKDFEEKFAQDQAYRKNNPFITVPKKYTPEEIAKIKKNFPVSAEDFQVANAYGIAGVPDLTAGQDVNDIRNQEQILRQTEQITSTPANIRPFQTEENQQLLAEASQDALQSVEPKEKKTGDWRDYVRAGVGVVSAAKGVYDDAQGRQDIAERIQNLNDRPRYMPNEYEFMGRPGSQSVIYAKHGAQIRTGTSSGAEEAELERGEMFMLPNMDSYVVGGKKHSQGGEDFVLPEGTIVFSDHLKVPGLKNTFSQEAKKLDITKYKEILDNPHAKSVDRTTAEVMMSRNLKRLEQLFQIQQAMNGNSTGEMEPEAKRMGQAGLFNVPQPSTYGPNAPLIFNSNTAAQFYLNQGMFNNPNYSQETQQLNSSPALSPVQQNLEDRGIPTGLVFEASPESDDAWIRKILEYEETKGGYDPDKKSAYGLSNWGYNSRDPKSIDEAIAFFKQDFLPKVQQYPAGVKERMADYIYNTGRSPEDFLLYAAGKITLSQLNSPKNFTSEWNKFKPEIEKMMADPSFVQTIDNKKADVYKTTKGGTLKNPNPAYNATWSDRINMWNTDPRNKQAAQANPNPGSTLSGNNTSQPNTTSAIVGATQADPNSAGTVADTNATDPNSIHYKTLPNGKKYFVEGQGEFKGKKYRDQYGGDVFNLVRNRLNQYGDQLDPSLLSAYKLQVKDDKLMVTNSSELVDIMEGGNNSLVAMRNFYKGINAEDALFNPELDRSMDDNAKQKKTVQLFKDYVESPQYAADVAAGTASIYIPWLTKQPIAYKDAQGKTMYKLEDAEMNSNYTKQYQAAYKAFGAVKKAQSGKSVDMLKGFRIAPEGLADHQYMGLPISPVDAWGGNTTIGQISAFEDEEPIKPKTPEEGSVKETDQGKDYNTILGEAPKGEYKKAPFDLPQLAPEIYGLAASQMFPYAPMDYNAPYLMPQTLNIQPQLQDVDNSYMAAINAGADPNSALIATLGAKQRLYSEKQNFDAQQRAATDQANATARWQEDVYDMQSLDRVYNTLIAGADDAVTAQRQALVASAANKRSIYNMEENKKKLYIDNFVRNYRIDGKTGAITVANEAGYDPIQIAGLAELNYITQANTTPKSTTTTNTTSTTTTNEKTGTSTSSTTKTTNK